MPGPEAPAVRRPAPGLAAVLLAALGAGCLGRGPGPAGWATGAAGRSQVALESPANVHTASSDDLRISAVTAGHVLPVPSEPLRQPDFPRAALGRYQGIAVVHVVLSVDEHGRVVGVARDPMRFSTPTPVDQLFDAAIANASQQWNFQPGYAVSLLPGQDGNPVVGDVVPEAAEVAATITFSAAGGVAVSSGR